MNSIVGAVGIAATFEMSLGGSQHCRACIGLKVENRRARIIHITNLDYYA